MGILEKISEIEAEIARTQKNKATEYHLGLLKGKLARFRAELLENQTKSSGGKGEGFDVMKSGDARVALIGFPSGSPFSLYDLYVSFYRWLRILVTSLVNFGALCLHILAVPPAKIRLQRRAKELPL